MITDGQRAGERAGAGLTRGHHLRERGALSILGDAGDPVALDGALGCGPAHCDGVVLHICHVHVGGALHVYGERKREGEREEGVKEGDMGGRYKYITNDLHMNLKLFSSSDHSSLLVDQGIISR